MTKNPTFPAKNAAVGAQLCALVTLGLLSGCGLFESAGEVTIGEGQIPDLVLDFEMPSHDSFLAEQRAVLDDADGVPDGVSIENASLAHVLGMVTLSGHCERTFRKPGKADLGAASDLVSRFIACPSSGVCDHLCGQHRGVLLDFDVEVLALTEKTTKDIKAKVQQRIDDTLVGMRMKFLEVLPYVREDSKRVSRLSRIHRIDARVTDDANNDLPVIRDVHIKLIRAGQQPRVTFAADAPFTSNLVNKMEAGKDVTFRLRAQVWITPGDAYHWPIFNSGFRIRVQPEFVISVLGSVS